MEESKLRCYSQTPLVRRNLSVDEAGFELLSSIQRIATCPHSLYCPPLDLSLTYFHERKKKLLTAQRKRYIEYLADLPCVAKPAGTDNVIGDRLGLVNLRQLQKWRSAKKMKRKINWGKQSKQALQYINDGTTSPTHSPTVCSQTKLAVFFQKPVKHSIFKLLLLYLANTS